MFIFHHQQQCFKQHNPTPAQTLSLHSGEWHNVNLKTKRHHTDMIPSTPFHLLYLVCHVETNTIWVIVIWTIQSVSVYYCSCWKQQDENSIKTVTLYDMDGASSNLIHSLIDSNDISWLGGIYSPCFVWSLTYHCVLPLWSVWTFFLMSHVIRVFWL